MKFLSSASLLLWAVALATAESSPVFESTSYRVDPDQPRQRLAATEVVRAVGLIAGHHGHVRLRGSRDGMNWGEWREAIVGHEGGTLVWFETGVREVELQSPVDVRVVWIEPGSTAAGGKLPGRSADGEVIPRSQWGCGAECAPREAPIYANVTHLVVHHSAGGNEASDWAAVIRSIWVLHVRGNGWNDIGYNFLIDPLGRIYEGRAGGDGVIGAHFSGVNTGTMGVCMVGTYSNVPPTAAAVSSLARLLANKAARWNLDPAGETLHTASGLSLNVISGHRDAGLSPRASGTTECPGNALYSYLPAVRTAVFARNACNIELARRNYCFGGSGGAVEVAFENPRNCNVSVELDAPWLEVAEGRLRAAANAASTRRRASLKVGGQVIEVTQAEAGVSAPPCVARGGIVNAASFDARPIGQGSIVSVFGTDLADDTGRVDVVVNGRLNATVFAATPGQLNFALPAGVNPGSARLEVLRNGTRSAEAMFWVSEAVPGVFAAVNHEDGTVNSTTRPVRAGAPLVVYLTGTGTSTRLPWRVTVGGQEAQGLYLGPTPGFTGLAQANLIVPENTAAGEHPLEVIVSGVASRALPISVVK